MSLDVFKNGSGRYKTDFYETKISVMSAFLVAETTSKGTLLTEFLQNGDVVNQVYRQSKDSLEEMRAYLGKNDIKINEKVPYAPLKIKSKCHGCGKEEMRRELESVPAEKISDVPVVPIFVCGGCGKRYYTMNELFLKNLVAMNKDLFESADIKEMQKDEDAFIHNLREYVIRTFASKKIARLDLNKT
jgi:hypothetical protein